MLNRGLVGLAIWDYGQKNALDVEYAKVDPDFYRDELSSKLEKFRYLLPAVEMQQEAHYQSESNRSWSKLDLLKLPNFRRFLVMNRLWIIHVKNQDVETPEIVAGHIRRALKVMPVEKLAILTDCGCFHLPRDVAFAKLKAMVEGTRIVRQELGTEPRQ